MNLQRMTLQRVRDTASTPFRAGAQTLDADLGHPDLTQFVTELAAAPPDAGPNPAPLPAYSPSRRHPTRDHGSR
jgi:hypothetical protein